jgi:PAS domain S-box-containing protein
VDKKWMIAYQPTPYFFKTHKRWDAWIISFLLGAFLFVLLRRSRELETENIKRKKAQNELSTSETKVRRLLESAPDALLLVDIHGNILFANKEVETIFGYSPNELIGKWHDILVPGSIRTIHTNHRSKYFKNPHTRPMGEGLELWGLKKDGQKFPIAIKLSPLILEDQTQVICIVRDITKQKQSEDAIKQRSNELKSLYEMGQGLSEILSIDQVIQSALKGINNSISPDTSDIFLREGDKLIPQPAHDKINGLINVNQHFHKVGECLCGLAASTEKSIYSVNIMADKRCTWTECKNAGIKSFASIPLKGKEGLIGVMGVGSLTKRDFGKQSEFLETLAQQVAIALENALFYQKISNYADDLEKQVGERTQELQAALKNAESADRLKSIFLASMSHELRTPLNSIIGFTGIMLQGIVGALNQEQTKQLTMVKNSAGHLLGLINDILDLSKIEAGEVKIQLEDIDFVKLLEKVVQTIQPLSDEKQLKLSYETPDSTFQIKTDSQKVEQILINLINNAIKFTEKGSVKIVYTKNVDELKISIIDTGIGLKKDELETVFDTFHQTDTGLARKYEGTGLGLSICRKLTELLGGKIWAQSDGKNKGSTFSFTLPIKER